MADLSPSRTIAIVERFISSTFCLLGESLIEIKIVLLWQIMSRVVSKIRLTSLGIRNNGSESMRRRMLAEQRTVECPVESIQP